MKNRFVISENDRRSILSMYGLLNEEIKDYTISGVVKDKNNEPVSYVKVTITSDDSNEKSINTTTDFDGNFTIIAKLDDTKTYYINIKSKEHLEYKETIDKNKTSNLSIVLTPSEGEIKTLQDFVISSKRFTNIKLSVSDDTGNPITGYNLLIKNKNKSLEQITSEKSIFDLNVLNNDSIIDKMESVKEYSYNPSSNDIFYTDQKTDETTIQIVITKEGYEESKTKHDIILNNAFATFEIATKDGENKIKKSEPFDVTIKTPNNINITINKTIPEKIKFIIYDVDKIPMGDVNVEGLNSGYKGITNENGEVDFELKDDSVGQTLNFTFKKDGYKTQYKEIEIKKTNNLYKLKFLSKKQNQFSLGDEPLDTYKDSMYSLYGRSETDLSNKESIKLAKLNAINKYIEKHKKRYKDLEPLKDIDVEIEYELSYGRPLKTAKTKQKYFNIVKINKKNIKNYLNKLLKKENIQPVYPPVEFDELTLPEAIEIAYQQGQEILILAGLDGEELTDNLKKKLDKSKISKDSGVNKKYLPLFINNDRNDSNNKILRSIVPYGDYPRIIILKPKNNKEVSVVTNNLQI
jgi:hypothetical protein